jgi:2,3-bisphosphoglycerate-independent phosphoglycerate mutase
LEHVQNAVASIEESYEVNVTDEFIHPTVLVDEYDQPATIEEDDVVIFFNFRTDRGRELTEVLTQMDCHKTKNMHKLNLYYVTLPI